MQWNKNFTINDSTFVTVLYFIIPLEKLFSSNRGMSTHTMKDRNGIYVDLRVFTRSSNKHLWSTEHFQNFAKNMKRLGAHPTEILFNKFSQGNLLFLTVQGMEKNKRIPNLKDWASGNLASKLFTLQRVAAST